MWNPFGDDIYYRIYLSHENKPVVVCMQWLDEHHYDAARFLDHRLFEIESDAQRVLAQQMGAAFGLPIPAEIIGETREASGG
jgi:hypothetical protein